MTALQQAVCHLRAQARRRGKAVAWLGAALAVNLTFYERQPHNGMRDLLLKKIAHLQREIRQ